MKRILVCIAVLLLCLGAGHAEELLTEANLGSLHEFARQHGVLEETHSLLQAALQGDMNLPAVLADWLRAHLREPAELVLSVGTEILAPVLLLALLKTLLPESAGAGAGAVLLLRITILLAFARLSELALERAGDCLRLASRFSDTISPLLTVLIAATGMEGTAALVSPAAALAGSIAEKLFQNVGLPLCRAALCAAIAGNLSREISMARFFSMFRRAGNWMAGLATTLFTALLSLQGTVTADLDGVAMRTAKFAVDSAAPVIGSGVSDAWESYISGVLVAKNALGVSGIAALLLSGLEPVLVCLAAMCTLNLISALLEMFGEKETSAAAAQAAGVCQMALSLCTASLAIGMILLGAAMSVGRGLAA